MEQKRLKIEKLSIKDGNTNGRNWRKLGIFCDGVWYSAFSGPNTETWKVGDDITVNVEKNGDYLNIVFPKAATAKSAGPANIESTALLKEILDVGKKIISILMTPPTALAGIKATKPVTNSSNLPPEPPDFSDADFPGDADDSDLPF